MSKRVKSKATVSDSSDESEEEVSYYQLNFLANVFWTVVAFGSGSKL